MGFKLSATVANKNTPITPPTIDISTLGVWKGEELTNHNCPDGILDKIQDKFRKMTNSQKALFRIIAERI